MLDAADLQKGLLQLYDQVTRRERGLFDTLDAANDWLIGQP